MVVSETRRLVLLVHLSILLMDSGRSRRPPATTPRDAVWLNEAGRSRRDRDTRCLEPPLHAASSSIGQRVADRLTVRPLRGRVGAVSSVLSGAALGHLRLVLHVARNSTVNGGDGARFTQTDDFPHAVAPFAQRGGPLAAPLP